MMTDLLVGLLFLITLAAGIWGWRLENGGSKLTQEDASESTESLAETDSLAEADTPEIDSIKN